MVHKQVASLPSPAEMVNFKFVPSISVSCGSQLCALIPNYHDLQENLSPEWNDAYGSTKAQASQAVSCMTSFRPLLFYYTGAGGIAASTIPFPFPSAIWMFCLICFFFQLPKFPLLNRLFQIITVCTLHTHIDTHICNIALLIFWASNNPLTILIIECYEQNDVLLLC